MVKSELYILVSVFLVSLLLILPLHAAASGQSSSSYVIQKDVISNGGGERLSTGFILRDTLGQSSAAGESSSGSFRLFAGFWGPLGSILPPVVPAMSGMGLLTIILGFGFLMRKRRINNLRVEG